ncbi:MAG: hypothetical protein QUU85_19875, partial [Candidatus Eisenbacteria bacterium]|nr:hypothetical protein [Candidatus Eisenbacteria bacterium]
MPTFQDLIAENRRNSILLVLGFVVLVALTVYVFAVALIGYSPRDGLVPAVIALVVAGFLALWSLYGGAGAILGMSGAVSYTHLRA